MWNFPFKKKKESPIEDQSLQVDLHSHLIPGIDDGAKTEDDSILLMRGFHNLGYRKLITTPHIYHGVYNNTPSIILSGCEKLRKLCATNEIFIDIEAAGEYYFDNYFFELIEKKELLTFGNGYVLFELPMNTRPAMVEDVVFKLNLAGYKPVLAHPERYLYFHDRKMRDYQKLKDLGLYFQVNLMSLTGYYNEAIKRAAFDLMKHSLVDFAGSDLHREKHLSIVAKGLRQPELIKLIREGRILNNNL